MKISPLFPALAVFAASGGAAAQQAEEILVIGVAPAGSEVDINKLAHPVQTATADDLRNIAATGIADFLRGSFSSISLNDAQNNPVQPDLQYRGFTASPLLGLAQGIAVYQNGVRVNEPLGDAVNWDLLPQSAIQTISLAGGANPLYGLNSLGGSLVIDMKDGFDYQGANISVSTGSFGRRVSNLEFGGNDDRIAYYADIEYFDEDGWRDYSDSEVLNFYGSLGWRSEYTRVNLNYQHGESELIGNGASPVELLGLDREAIFTGPDITENGMDSLSLDFSHEVSAGISFSGLMFYRENQTTAFNGDGTEFAICEFNGMNTLIEGLEEDELEELGLDDDDVCGSRFNDAEALENFLNHTAMMNGGDDAFDIEGFESDELSGTGLLADDAINNLSNRNQESSGIDFQWTFTGNYFGYEGRLVVGGAYFNGESTFDSVVELSDIDPLTRLTTGLGTGTFVDGEATDIATQTQSASLYIANILDLSDTLTLSLSARANQTDIDLRDKSGERPELNGSHRFNRINPAIGLSWQAHENHNLYASYSESSRAPTPIELACNEGVFDLAVQFAIADGEDPDDVDFECRLPNAFLADPPLDDVVTRGFEFGSRGRINGMRYAAGLFNTANHDDILFQTTGRATGLFANVDKTRRRGFEASLGGRLQKLDWTLAYSHVEATFEADFDVLSPNHEFAGGEGRIAVRRGDSIPGIPENQFKLVADYPVLDRLRLGLDLISNSGQYLRGDESNQMDEIDGYTVVNLRARYRFNDDLELFAQVHNLFDRDFETFGLLGEEPGELEVPVIEDLEIPVFLGPAPPRAVFLGVRYNF